MIYIFFSLITAAYDRGERIPPNTQQTYILFVDSTFNDFFCSFFLCVLHCKIATFALDECGTATDASLPSTNFSTLPRLRRARK